jgi:hypothetical protein
VKVRPGIATLVALALAGGLPAACGNKTQVRPPQLIQPRPPTSLGAHSSREGVTLTWRRPVTYTGGGRMNDLGGFDIERGAAEGGPEDFVHVGTLTLDDQERFRQERAIEWTDTSAVVGEGYRYRVISFTLDGYHSVPAGPVEVKFDPSKAPPEKPKPAPPSGQEGDHPETTLVPPP